MNNNVNKPLVSILVPVYNRKELSKEAIISSINQTYQNIEIIVCDNCSTDGTYEFLYKEFKTNDRVKVYQNEKNLGAVGNWKKCLEKAKGKYIKFLWSDDLMEKTFIERAVQLLEQKDYAFVYSAASVFTESDSNGKVYSIKETLYSFDTTGEYDADVFISNHLMLGGKEMPVSPGCAVFKKDYVKIDDNIPNTFDYKHFLTGAGVDLLIFLNAFDYSSKFYFINEGLNYFREHSGSITCSDNTIYVGYMTAKVYFAKSRNNKKYIDSLKKAIIYSQKGLSAINRKKTISLLDKYLFDIDYKKPNCFELFGILMLKIKNHIIKK